jgi:uncharacterized membrane protein (UPF0127 family)
LVISLLFLTSQNVIILTVHNNQSMALDCVYIDDERVVCVIYDG